MCVSVQPMDAEIFRLTESRCVANHQLRQTFEPPGKHQLSPTAAGKLASAAIREEGLAGGLACPGHLFHRESEATLSRRHLSGAVTNEIRRVTNELHGKESQL